ncbi:hypothetical protein QBC35DRAFT_457468 [Podospora australis]|uniref:Uncharacterized protein n=1 Tax=Podospora australis TaxID=1536484 RepID=A0AAN6WJ89_9PEZI|nr:hypothetical protein QBC35DRAFT_457468 [Podospora australis]
MRGFIFATAFTGVASMAIAPSMSSEKLDIDTREPGLPPTVDASATRSAWVSSYSYGKKKFDWGQPGLPPTVDASATRSAWVSSYSYGKKKFEWEHPNHWLPSGPGYLDLDSLEKGYRAHLMAMDSSASWLHTSVVGVKRFIGM